MKQQDRQSMLLPGHEKLSLVKQCRLLGLGRSSYYSDQGSQFTSTACIKALESRGVQVSMDGRGRCYDNIFIERLWRSVKRACLYLHAFENGSALRQGFGKWFDWYNQVRPHQSLEYRTPDEVHQEGLEIRQAA